MNDDNDFRSKFLGIIIFFGMIAIIVLLIMSRYPEEGSPEWVKKECRSINSESDCIDIERCRNNIENFNKTFTAKNCSFENIEPYPAMTGVVPE